MENANKLQISSVFIKTQNYDLLLVILAPHYLSHEASFNNQYYIWMCSPFCKEFNFL